MQYKFFPIALLSNTAATVESTPPESPSKTLSFPNFFFKILIFYSTNNEGVQSCLRPQI